MYSTAVEVHQKRKDSRKNNVSVNFAINITRNLPLGSIRYNEGENIS